MEFPRIMYHACKGDIVVQSASHYKSLGLGWRDTSFDVENSQLAAKAEAAPIESPVPTEPEAKAVEPEAKKPAAVKPKPHGAHKA